MLLGLLESCKPQQGEQGEIYIGPCLLRQRSNQRRTRPASGDTTNQASGLTGCPEATKLTVATVPANPGR
jgi:hypothetical protein